MSLTQNEIAAFMERFEAGTLSRAEWNHAAHLTIALWYARQTTGDEGLAIVRERIRACNTAVGIPNTDQAGYHETLTRLFWQGVCSHHKQHEAEPLASSLERLLMSRLADRKWGLAFYKRDTLYSKAARLDWVEPDLVPPARLTAAIDRSLGFAGTAPSSPPAA
ncbi:MAG: hypothetical protein KF777_08480 [Planctomycetaceae bacterium]|nr:hypothetical protein [Planctomycetaceae bacterium]